MKRKILSLFILLSLLPLGACGNSSSTPTCDSKAEWTVTFDLNYQGSTSFTKKVQNETKITPPEESEAVYDGHSLLGWYRDSYCKVEWKFNSDLVYADTTLYAKWEVETATSYSVTWTKDNSFNYEMLGQNDLPLSVNKGTSLSFKVNVNEGYEGTPVVKANDKVLSATDGVYTHVVSSDVIFTVSGLNVISSSWVGDQDFFIQMGDDWNNSQYKFKSQMSGVHQCEEFYWEGYIENNASVQFRREAKTLPDTTVSGYGLALDQLSTQNLLKVVSSTEHGVNDSNQAWYNGTDGQMTFVGTSGNYTIYIRVYDNANADGAQNDRWLNVYMEAK